MFRLKQIFKVFKDLKLFCNFQKLKTNTNLQTMKKNLFILKYPKTIVTITIIILLVSLVPLVNVQINSDLMSYLPDDLPAMVNKSKVEEIFGKKDHLIIVFEADDVLNDSTLRRIKALSKAFNRMNDFDMVMSLFDSKNIRGEGGAMLVDPVVKRIPKSKKRREKLREQIKANELAYGLVVSEDFKYTTILLNSVTKKEDSELIKLIMNTLSEHPGSETININGQPYLRAEANDKIARDLMILLPIGLLLMGIFLWVSFREKRGVLLPTFVVATSIVISMALIPLFGWELSIIGILIPIMMIAIANDYGIHFISKYQELNAANPDMDIEEMVTLTTKYLRSPIILTGITTIVGIAGLATHIMLPAKQMGIVSAIGIGFALFASLTFIPAIMVFMKKGKPHHSFTENGKKSFMDKILHATANFVTTKPKQVLYLFACFLIVAVLGLSYFQIASDFDAILPEKHGYNVSLDIVNEHFGGTKSISVIFEGDVKQPEVLERMLKYEEELEKIPGVGSVNSLATMVRIMSRALNDPTEPLYNRIPDTRNAVAQYIEFYAMSGDPEDFENYVDFDYTKAAMHIQYHANDMETSNSIIDKVTAMVANDPNLSVVGGHGIVENQMSKAIAVGQVYSLLFAFFAIMILLMIIFRSVTAGILGSFPLLFAVVATFGLMGWFGIELNIVTALLSSISIGLGVDYTIHIFWRLKTELKTGKDYPNAIITSLKTTGRGIAINAFSVIIGFSVLFISAFPLIRSFAFLIILSIILCLVAALVLVPTLCLLVKPKFLEK